ncbi:MAG: chromosome segregation protein SMC [Pseudomonadota bacterium]
MHFSKLRLSGFKSFVDTTDLPIEPGITGVIGPNGCGKSNLLEALRWVMGETSAKSMRGAGMEDVIFAGAATRPARNFAEVVLSVDNKERRAPQGFNDADEIEITRRIARDMGSSYKYNGKDIRARDAQTLFADAATGAQSPALVRQGQISEIINAKPKARKRILEDAAGIAGLHARRHEATLRLNSAETNLARIVEVLAQLEAREASLQREAERASKYRALSQELRMAEAIAVFRRWREADRERVLAEEAMAQSSSVAGKAAQAASEASRLRLEAEEKTPRLREDEAIARALHQKLLIEAQGLDGKEREARDAVDRLKRQLAQLAQDLEREAAIEVDAGQMRDRLAAEREALSAESDDADALAEAQAAEEAASREARMAEAAVDRLNADAARVEAERKATAARLEEARRAVERLAAEALAADQRRGAVALEMESAKEGAAEVAEVAEEARMAIAEADDRAAAAEEARASALERAQSARAALGDAQGAAAALRSEATQLRRSLEGGAISGEPILERLRVAAGVETALGAALGDDLQAPEAAGGAARYGWIALPPLQGAPALPPGAQPLAELVEAPPALARRLGQTGLVDRAEGGALQARLAPGQRLVSREGDLWRWDGFCASAEDGGGAAALRLAQQNRLEEVEAELAEAEAALERLSEAHRSADAEAASCAERDAQARSSRRRAEEQAAAAARAATEAEGQASRLHAQLASLAEVISARAADREDAAAQLAEAEEAAALFEAPETDAASVEGARAELESKRAAFMEARAARDQINRRSDARAERLAAIEREFEGWRTRRDASARQKEVIAERIAQAEAEREAAEAAPLAIEERRAELSEQAEAAEARLVAAVDALAGVEAALREAAQAEKEASAELAEAREGRARLEARMEAAKERAVEHRLTLEDSAGCAPENFLERFNLDPDDLPNVKDLERSISQLKQSRDRLGAVNLRADQELAEVSEEREGLARERADLDAAIGKLRQGVNALNREGRERLLAAFEEVNKNFATLFTHLFDGGDARLVLVESDDPLEAGLEILCQPPGKRLANLSLLSGGEQTLTAISLIFAVFMVNPAPICVLDEVDAPLDDANVSRFCDLLDEMTRRTQTRFLIITHHAVSMSRMDRLFGVTMVEKGVSQLVSVDLNTAVSMVDA